MSRVYAAQVDCKDKQAMLAAREKEIADMKNEVGNTSHKFSMKVEECADLCRQLITEKEVVETLQGRLGSVQERLVCIWSTQTAVTCD